MSPKSDEAKLEVPETASIASVEESEESDDIEIVNTEQMDG